MSKQFTAQEVREQAGVEDDAKTYSMLHCLAELLERPAGVPAQWRLAFTAAKHAIERCKTASGQHRAIDTFVNAIQIAHDVCGTDTAQQPDRAAAEVPADSAPPYANCRFQICDLPGQCRGEGACHHPAVPAALAQHGEDAERAFDLLDLMFSKWENGTPCHEYSDGEEGAYIGSAFRLEDDEFSEIVDLLNKHRPSDAAIAQQAAKEGE